MQVSKINVINIFFLSSKGDFDQKPYVSNEADSSSVHLNGDEDYVLLACDGFFDVVRPGDVPGLVLEALREGRGSGEDVAQSLVAQAKAAGSSDNITVLLVFLKEPQQLLTHEMSSRTEEGGATAAATVIWKGKKLHMIEDDGLYTISNDVSCWIWKEYAIVEVIQNKSIHAFRRKHWTSVKGVKGSKLTLFVAKSELAFIFVSIFVSIF